MSIEESEARQAGAVRGLLGTAFGEAEPPLRDLASGSIARGDAARRRVRWYTAGGAVLSAAAVIGTFAVVAAGGGAADKGPAPGGASTPKPTSKAGPTPTPGQDANTRLTNDSDKVQDVTMHLPGLLQPLLPSGITIVAAPPDFSVLNRANFVLTDPTGTTEMTAAGGRVDWAASTDRQTGCLQMGGCEVHKVAGGTVYVNDSSHTAADQSSGYPKGALKPGTEKTVVYQDVWMTYVPDDRSKQYLQIREATSVAAMPFADKAPAGWTQSWPPSDPGGGVKYAADPRGVAISADGFAALVAKPGIEQAETLLDPKTAASPDAVQAQDARNAQVAALLKPVLPDGVTPDARAGAIGHELTLTGTVGENLAQIRTSKQSASYRRQMITDKCPSQILRCEQRAVPGGKVVAWAQLPTDSNLHPTSDKPDLFQFWFFPDDLAKPVVEFDLTTNTRSSAPDDPVLTTDQFAAAASNPQLASIVEQVNALTNP